MLLDDLTTQIYISEKTTNVNLLAVRDTSANEAVDIGEIIVKSPKGFTQGRVESGLVLVSQGFSHQQLSNIQKCLLQQYSNSFKSLQGRLFNPCKRILFFWLFALNTMPLLCLTSSLEKTNLRGPNF